MNREHGKLILVYVGLIAALLTPRLPALNSFATLDEPYWLSMGANFYYALGQHEFDHTVYEYQPAVTTMWIVTAAMLIYFPQYRGLGQGYLDYEKGTLDPFLLEHGKDPLVLLQIARSIQVLFIVLLMLLVFYLLEKLIGKIIAIFAVLLLSFEPFFLSQTRLLDHEAMLALFILISVLALLNYLYQGRKPVFLILSGLAAGLAQLTKSSGIAMLAPIGICLLFYLWQERRTGFGKTFVNVVKVFGFWFAILALTYFIFWPGMWTAPGKMLYEVYGNAFSYAFQGARLKVTSDIEPAQISLDTNLGSFGQLMNVILWRTTPLTWLGVLFVLIFPFTRDWKSVRSETRLTILLLIVTAFAFVLMFALAKGRNSPHYTLTSYAALSLLAGMGWFYAAGWFAKRAKWISFVVLSAVILLQAWSALTYYPYYFTYENLILLKLTHRSFPQFTYGEGLELAAQYLAQMPDAKDSVTLAYYERGCFSYFYPGQTTRFKPYYADAGYGQELLDALHGADYLVIYYAVQGNLDKYSKLIQTLTRVQPEHEIWLNGYKYALVYRVDSFSPAVYDALVK
jgi:hypothetical protein